MKQKKKNNSNFNALEVTQQLVVFSLLHLIPFVPRVMLQAGQQQSHHRRDASSIITFKGVPSDNYGSIYAMSLPSGLDPHTILQTIQESNPSSSYVQRPRLLSPAMVYGEALGRMTGPMESENSIKTTIRLTDDIMQAVDMSRKAFSLLYQVSLKFWGFQSFFFSLFFCFCTHTLHTHIAHLTMTKIKKKKELEITLKH